MTEILEFLLAVLLLFFVLHAISLAAKRASLVRKLKKLGKTDGISVRLLRNPYVSLLRLSAVPEAEVRIRDAVYLVRFYNGGAGKSVHFASDRYTVKFGRLKTARYSRGAKGAPGSSFPISIGTRVRVLPKMDCSGYESAEVRAIPVIIFNPAPYEVSYVTDEKTSIKVAFTGDSIYGAKIFTASTFIAYADREARQTKERELCRL